MNETLIKTIVIGIIVVVLAYNYIRSSKKAKFVDLLWKEGKLLELTNPDAPYNITVIKYKELLYDTNGNRMYQLAKAAPKQTKIIS